MKIENYPHLAGEIASDADVETLDSYEDRIHHYENMNYTYIPIPAADKYYNTEEGWIRDLHPEQIIDEEIHLIDALKKMQSYPFLLIDRHINTYVSISVNGELLTTYEARQDMTTEEVKETLRAELREGSESDYSVYTIDEARAEYPDTIREHPDLKEYDDRFRIITLVDLNKRDLHEMLYRVLSALAARLSEKIEEEYPDSSEVHKYVRANAIGRWKKDQLEGLDLHIAEHMNLLDMMQVIQASSKRFVEDCGFSSKSDVETLHSINEIRNRVMHANRSLIYDRKDIQDVIQAVNDSERILSNMQG